ncbi:hypothetical protein [uncultured Campylobacter sp.]|uniref:hypothetical protein n=1 Tax=uncultured Campylobacter sp. TaxID=218934 RepID=UPI00261D8E4D|nr:hypothetical protein [uncultured Campylobacter sp.]
MKYALGAALAALIFAGCGDNDVELVKNYTLPDFKSMSIGAAIEGSKICKSVTWSKEENGGLKTVKMVCDVDMEKVKVDVDAFNKKYKEATLNTSLRGAVLFYKDKSDDKQQRLLKLANEHCKINETKFQEELKDRGKIDYSFQKKPVDCDDKLKDEILKDGEPKTSAIYMSDIIDSLEDVAYYSQLTPSQIRLQLGKAAELPPQAAIELNFIVNADKSISLSDKFMVTEDVADDIIKTSSFTGKRVAEDALVIFYERK